MRPTGFLRPKSKWSRLLRTQSDHRLWETAVLFHLRDALRAGDVWLARSRRYGDIRKALLSAPAVAGADRSLPAPASPHDWLAERRFALAEGLRRLAAAARAGELAGGSIEDSVLRVERTEGAVPDGAADLVADLYRRLPEARITDILLEVDDATRFTEAFTHLRTGEPCRDRIGLLNVLLAEGVNLGLRKMAEATTTHGFWELMRIARWHVEGDAFDRALAVVVEAQAALPMAAFWGTGRTASSDGQFFPAGGRGEALNLVNARYGAEPGVKAYSHVSDRFSPFATQTIPATVHEAPYILDGLLMNETGRRVREQYADTGGFTDHVFAACSILGYAFVPRIRDLPSKRLYVFERAGVPKPRPRPKRRPRGTAPPPMPTPSARSAAGPPWWRPPRPPPPGSTTASSSPTGETGEIHVLASNVRHADGTPVRAHRVPDPRGRLGRSAKHHAGAPPAAGDRRPAGRRRRGRRARRLTVEAVDLQPPMPPTSRRLSGTIRSPTAGIPSPAPPSRSRPLTTAAGPRSHRRTTP